ncbi:MAG: hypothetical protein ACI8X5_001067 [Planctomycetota bacterium]|jgi:hypothetical protein
MAVGAYDERVMSRFFRHPVVAVLFGILLPIGVFWWVFWRNFDLGQAYLLSPWENAFVFSQLLFIGLSALSLGSWLIFKRRAPWHYGALFACTGSAILLGIFSMPIVALISFNRDPSFFLALVAPWLVAATYGASAQEARVLAKTGRAWQTSFTLGALPVAACALVVILPIALLWGGFMVSLVRL